MIRIRYNPDEEMIAVSKDSKIIFSGNYWDFPNSPTGISTFLKNLGLEVDIEKTEEDVNGV